MMVGGRGDCDTMDIVGGGDSLPTTLRSNKYILTIIDCFSRYALAITLKGQSDDSVVNVFIAHYVTIYGTPHCILTDQNTNFESERFHKFCILFRICKIRNTSYHPNLMESARDYTKL